MIRETLPPIPGPGPKLAPGATTRKSARTASANGHRREYDPRRTKRQTFQDRTDRAIADVGMYRNVAYRDVVDAHFEGHPYTARRAVDQMVRAGHVREHNAEGPQGGSYKVLTLTERGVERAERVARDQGLDSQQKAWSQDFLFGRPGAYTIADYRLRGNGFRTAARFGTPFAAAPAFECWPIMAFQRSQRAL